MKVKLKYQKYQDIYQIVVKHKTLFNPKPKLFIFEKIFHKKNRASVEPTICRGCNIQLGNWKKMINNAINILDNLKQCLRQNIVTLTSGVGPASHN